MKWRGKIRIAIRSEYGQKDSDYREAIDHLDSGGPVRSPQRLDSFSLFPSVPIPCGGVRELDLLSIVLRYNS